MKTSALSLGAGCAICAIASGPTLAASPLSTGPSTVVNAPLSPTCTTSQSSPCAESYSFATRSTADPTITDNPTSYTFADTFNQLGSTQTGSDFGASVYTGGLAYAVNPKCPAGPNCLDSSPLLTWNFQDNYDFTTPSNGPLVSGAALSFALPDYGVGLGNLEARIVAYGDSSSTAADLVSTGNVTVVDGWRTISQSIGAEDLYTAVLNSTPLAASTEYVLQIRGEALSAASYTGSVTFVPVPLPAPVGLLISGLFGLGLLRRATSRESVSLTGA